MQETIHIPVMPEETIALLAPKAGERIVDGTLGRAGHAARIAACGAEVLGIDRDGDAIAAANEKNISGLCAVHGNHGDIAVIAKAHGWEKVDGILLDLGVSSPQLDEAGRGFSFMREGPLDMRMDRTRGPSAADLINSRDAEWLEEVFREYGEEPQARRLARAIVEERVPRPFETTSALAEFVGKKLGYRTSHHPATRVFQALRMAVNDEAGELERALEGGMSLLSPGGRFAVITFESITDRIVKRFFASHVGRMESLQQGGERWVGSKPRARALTRRAVRPSEREIAANPRSRSAKLRAVAVI